MSSKEKVVNNFGWRLAERLGARGVEFIVSLILARMLAPEVYGDIALVTVFITILQVFVDSGLGNALIQKKNADDLDFSTVFFFNVFVCTALYCIMFIISPFIADFYNSADLCAVIRVLSLTILISGVKNVQQAYVSRNFLFKRFFFSTLGGTLFAAVIGIVLAYKGFGVWALVVQQVSNAFIDTVILWLTVKWKPKMIFSVSRLKSLFSYGWKLLVSSLLDTVYDNVRQLIIGKMYSSSDLAFYNKAKQFPQFIISNINTSINSVLLPAMSEVQEDKQRVKAMTRRSIKTSTYIMAPLMMGLAFCGETIVELLLTKKWLPAVPILRIFCITYTFYPIHTANLSAIKAMGRSDLYLILEICKKIVGILLLVSTMWFGVMAMAYSLLVSSLASQIINTWPNKQLLNYGYLEQMKDILPGISLAFIMGICVWGIGLFSIPLILKLIVQIILGAIIYIGLSKLLKLESYEYIMNFITTKFHKKKEKV